MTPLAQSIAQAELDKLNAEHPALYFSQNGEVVALEDVVRLEWIADALGTKRLRFVLTGGAPTLMLGKEESQLGYTKWLAARSPKSAALGSMLPWQTEAVQQAEIMCSTAREDARYWEGKAEMLTAKLEEAHKELDSLQDTGLQDTGLQLWKVSNGVEEAKFSNVYFLHPSQFLQAIHQHLAMHWSTPLNTITLCGLYRPDTEKHKSVGNMQVMYELDYMAGDELEGRVYIESVPVPRSVGGLAWEELQQSGQYASYYSSAEVLKWAVP